MNVNDSIAKSRVKAILGIDAPDNPETVPRVQEILPKFENDLKLYEEEVKSYLESYMSEEYHPGWRLKQSIEKSCKMIQKYKTIVEEQF